MYPLKPNAQRAKNIIVALWINIAMSVLVIISTGWQYLLFVGIRDRPDEIDMPTLETSDLLQSSVAFLNLALYIVTIVLFIMWFRRAYYNLHQLPGYYPRFTEGWAAGAWFIPFLNLVRPYQIMRAIWEGKQHYVSHRLGEVQSSGIVGTWWALWLTMSISSNIVFRISLISDDIGTSIIVALLSMIVEVLSIAAAWVAIVMIQKTSRFEKEVLEEATAPSDSIFSQSDEVTA